MASERHSWKPSLKCSGMIVLGLVLLLGLFTLDAASELCAGDSRSRSSSARRSISCDSEKEKFLKNETVKYFKNIERNLY